MTWTREALAGSLRLGGYFATNAIRLLRTEDFISSSRGDGPYIVWFRVTSELDTRMVMVEDLIPDSRGLPVVGEVHM